MAKYCPAGDGSFDEWVAACPECGRALVATPPRDDPKASDGPLVWLATAPNEPEAQMWAETIRGDGVPVFVKAGGPGVGAWASASSFEHELFVRERDLFKARRISRSLFSTAVTLGRALPRRAATPQVRPARKGGAARVTGA
ncbi:MAG: hypothetical protein H0W23_08530 [Chloroflexia bacterium]|nr:hypothetical protein [Chloroflexia bacterium]